MAAKYPVQWCKQCNKTYTKPNRYRHKHLESNQPETIIQQQQQECPCCLQLITKSHIARHLKKCKKNINRLSWRQLRSKSTGKSQQTICLFATKQKKIKKQTISQKIKEKMLNLSEVFSHSSQSPQYLPVPTIKQIKQQKKPFKQRNKIWINQFDNDASQ